jgi:hypothetical protein
VLESVAAMVVAGLSVLMPAPVVGVATEGQWTSIAQGGSAHDCDRVSIWSVKVYRLGRKTSCTTPGHRIAALSEIDNRAVWLHVSGDDTRTWTLWTATTTNRSPKLLASVTGPAGGSPPIVLGPGNMDRGQLTYAEGDALPYAIGRNVTVLNAAGKRTFTWTAPSDVVAFATDAEVLVIATADGTVFRFQYHGQHTWVQLASYPGAAVTGVAFDGLDVVVQRGRHVESISLEPLEPDECKLALTLGAGERLAGAGGGRVAIVAGHGFRVIPGCGGHPVASGTATAFSLDSNHFVTTEGRRVTRHQLPSP